MCPYAATLHPTNPRPVSSPFPRKNASVPYPLHLPTPPTLTPYTINLYTLPVPFARSRLEACTEERFLRAMGP
jgi:hypothetical protein